jgi:hypothetical protein
VHGPHISHGQKHLCNNGSLAKRISLSRVFRNTKEYILRCHRLKNGNTCLQIY